jgi:hypothetical protein
VTLGCEVVNLINAGVIRLGVLIGHLYLIGVGLCGDPRTNINKKHVEKRLDYAF